MTAIANDDWQAFRLSLKGLKTKEKLSKLDDYCFGGWTTNPVELGDRLVRVQNYLNALARGGQIAPTDKAETVYRQIRGAEILK